VPQMPQNVLRSVPPDHCLPAAKIASVLNRLASEGPQLRKTNHSVGRCDEFDRLLYQILTKL